VGGLLYVMGGKSSASNRLTTVRSYNPATNAWATLTQDPLPGSAREDPAVTAHDGLIYAFGGASANAFTANTTTAAVFDPAAAAGSRWNDGAVADLPAAVTGAAAISWNGLIWIIGGLNSSGNSINTVRTYDPATNSYATGPSLPSPRDNAGVAILNGHLYLFGGRNRQGGSGNSQTTVWRLQTPGGSWEQRASLPSARRAFVVGTAIGRAQLFGGESSATAAFTAVHEYDPTANAWTTLTAMPTGRHGPAGATISGITYVAGGATTSGAGSATTVNQAFTR
jgi:N-acetylneuraminic acid mutarotase